MGKETRVRRHLQALTHAVTLVWLAVIGIVLAVLTVILLFINFGFGGILLFPVTAGMARRSAIRARRRALAWSGVRIPDPYRPAPPPPVPQPDGLYRFGRRLYRTPKVPTRQDRLKWLFNDPATWRDIIWQLLDPFVAVALGGLPLLVIGYGMLTPWLWTPPAALAGIAAALVAVLALPRLIRLHALWSRRLLAPTARALLVHRMRHLARTRSDAVDSQAAELCRIERELHDGAQARLVALGMALAAARDLVTRDPAAAKALLARAREESATALAELRRVVRGIHPPVLAERGLHDAVRALALDSPLTVTVDADLPVRPPAPVESAAYFAISEALTMLTRVPDAERVLIDISHQGPRLLIAIICDGDRHAIARQHGFESIERRLAAFDGVLALTEDPGGYMMLTMELPHALAGSIADEAPKMPMWKTSLLFAGYSIGWLPLFPQGLAPAIFKIIGLDERAWFLALYLPEPYQWPVIFFMILSGLALYGAAIALPMTHSPDTGPAKAAMP